MRFLICVFFLVACGFSAVHEPLAFWNFESSENGVFASKSGGYSLSAEGGVVSTTGKFGQGLSFDGKTGMLQGKTPLPGERFTISAWIKLDDFTGGPHTIFVGNTKGSVYFRVNADGVLELVRAEVAIVGQAAQKLAPAVWNFAAVSFDKGEWTLFVNGKISKTGKTEETFSPAERFTVGKMVVPGAGPRPFRGMIDELAIYSESLAPSVLQSLSSVEGGSKLKERVSGADLELAVDASRPVSVTGKNDIERFKNMFRGASYDSGLPPAMRDSVKRLGILKEVRFINLLNNAWRTNEDRPWHGAVARDAGGKIIFNWKFFESVFAQAWDVDATPHLVIGQESSFYMRDFTNEAGKLDFELDGITYQSLVYEVLKHFNQDLRKPITLLEVENEPDGNNWVKY
ncbi:MAG: LamG domain-containing protein, partial [Spirochaetia bacterium]|nr:LamG domain-containing protein [Spirochaetia bacterium]